MYDSTCFAVFTGGALMPAVLPAPPADPSRIIMNILATMARSLSLSFSSFSLSLSKTTPVLPLPIWACHRFPPCNCNCYSPVNFSELYFSKSS